MSSVEFRCKLCDYVGMAGYMHMREEHGGQFYNDKQDEKAGNDAVMSAVEITRRIEFDAGHCIYGHESKCAHVHGHRYTVLITCAPKEGLDDLGRVIDFSVIKSKVGAWIDDHLDHGMLLWVGDPLACVWEDGFPAGLKRKATIVHKHYLIDDNPTAENIAKLIYHKSSELLADFDIVVTKVRVYETPNCFADYTG